MDASESLYLDLDGAWPVDALLAVKRVKARELGRELRFSATSGAMARFRRLIEPHAARFHLLGSGDFHHLTSTLLLAHEEPFTLVSFDNHPDWDIRPPRWCCGSWISRALERPALQQVTVWGCGNFEMQRPASFFGNHCALRSGRLVVRPWAERLPAAVQERWRVISRETWRSHFAKFIEQLPKRQHLYITIDLDALCANEAATNWENGLFTADDLVWALRELHSAALVIGGDICGAYSAPQFARWGQRFIADLDHPKLPPIDLVVAQARNVRALRTLWPALTGSDQSDPGRDEGDTEPKLRSGALLQEEPGRGHQHHVVEPVERV